MTIPLPTREEMLAADLPVERTFVTYTAQTRPDGMQASDVRTVTYRYATEEAANTHLEAERAALSDRSSERK